MQRVAAEQLECDEHELDERVAGLVAVLPGLTLRMHTMKAGVLAKLAEDPAAIAEKLLQLKAVFPTGNVQQMVLRDVHLLFQSIEDVSKAAADLRELLPPDVDVDRCRFLHTADQSYSYMCLHNMSRKSCCLWTAGYVSSIPPCWRSSHSRRR